MAEIGKWQVVFTGENVEQFNKLTVLPTDLNTAGLRSLPAEVREASFFSAKCSNARLLEEMQTYISKASAGEAGFHRLDFVKKMRGLLGIPPEKTREAGVSIEDMTSFQRLALIYDFWTRRIHARKEYEESLKKADLFPVQEFLRTQWRKEPREWLERWQAVGGECKVAGGEYGFRMLAPIGSPIWKRLSAFGTPFPPFDFNSGMGLRSIPAKEAIELGVWSFPKKDGNASAGTKTEQAPVPREMLAGMAEKIPARKIAPSLAQARAETREHAQRRENANKLNAAIVADLRKTFGDKVAIGGREGAQDTAVFCGSVGINAGRVWDAAHGHAARARVKGVSLDAMTLPEFSPRAAEKLAEQGLTDFEFSLETQTREQFKLAATLAIYPQLVRRHKDTGGYMFGRKVDGKWLWAMAFQIGQNALSFSVGGF